MVNYCNSASHSICFIVHITRASMEYINAHPKKMIRKILFLCVVPTIFVCGCSDPLRFNGSQLDDLKDRSQRIDDYYRPKISDLELINEWVVCGGSIYGRYNNKYIYRKYGNRNPEVVIISRCLASKGWIYRYCGTRQIFKNEPFCNHSISYTDAYPNRSYFFKSYNLWESSKDKTVKEAFDTCYAQDGRFWPQIVALNIEGLDVNKPYFNFEKNVTQCLLNQGLKFKACTKNKVQNKLFNEAAGGVEICPMQP